MPSSGAAAGTAASAAVHAATTTNLSGTLSCSGLEALWVEAGGSPAVEVTAASIAMAESGGNQFATGTVGERGYWQINPVNGSLSTYDPLRQRPGGGHHVRGRQQLVPVDHVHQRGVRRAAASPDPERALPAPAPAQRGHFRDSACSSIPATAHRAQAHRTCSTSRLSTSPPSFTRPGVVPGAHPDRARLGRTVRPGTDGLRAARCP